MKTTLRCFNRVMFLAIVGMAAGCGGDDSSPTGAGGAGGSGGSGGSGGGDSGEPKIGTSKGDWNVYPDPYGDGGASPVSSTMKGSVEAFSTGSNQMTVKLTVSGLPAARPFGSHLHKLACADNKAGAHYQHHPAPDGGASDPAYANSKNEVWLDFTTDAMGAGSAEAKVDWTPRAGEAKSVVIHDQPTKNDGTAGAKLACIDMEF
jgi:Cu-Zn family superoxide dismutase